MSDDDVVKGGVATPEASETDFDDHGGGKIDWRGICSLLNLWTDWRLLKLKL